jgi:hypothetical protein
VVVIIKIISKMAMQNFGIATQIKYCIALFTTQKNCWESNPGKNSSRDWQGSVNNVINLFIWVAGCGGEPRSVEK